MSSSNSWTGNAGNSNWDDPGNWSAGVVPTSGPDIVSIDKTGTYDVVIRATDPTYTLRDLAIGSASGTTTLTDESSLTVNTSAVLTGDSNVIVTHGATANLSTLSLGSSSTITDSSALNIDGGVDGGGVIDIDGGELFANSVSGTTSYILKDGAIATLATDSGSGGTIDFADSSGAELNLVVAGSSYAGQITGFGTSGNDVINLQSLAYSSNFTEVYSGSTLLINDGNSTKFVLTDINNASAVQLKSNSDGGTEIVSCFMAGTSIRTQKGDVDVETLAAGDLVTTTNGELKPIRWVGRQTVSMRFADPLRVAPIRLRAGALGQGIPSRDLLISAEHAVLLDGILIQAGALVNGVSITRELDVPTTFIYYHIELEDHSLIYANGVEAETYIDYLDRMSFDNWAEHDAICPQAIPIVEMPLPRAQSLRQVPPRLRQRLLMRAIDEGRGERVAA